MNAPALKEVYLRPYAPRSLFYGNSAEARLLPCFYAVGFGAVAEHLNVFRESLALRKGDYLGGVHFVDVQLAHDVKLPVAPAYVKYRVRVVKAEVLPEIANVKARVELPDVNVRENKPADLAPFALAVNAVALGVFDSAALHAAAVAVVNKTVVKVSGMVRKHLFPDHISVKQARVKGSSGDVLKASKSYAGTRDIPISTEFYEVLLAHMTDDRVCPLTSLQISRLWISFRDRIGLPEDCNFHALRHHFASRCLLLGMPQKYIAELMGHSSTDMIERVYQHTFESAMSEFAKKLRKENSEFMQHEIQHESEKIP